jgi:hypothetical protein
MPESNTSSRFQELTRSLSSVNTPMGKKRRVEGDEVSSLPDGLDRSLPVTYIDCGTQTEPASETYDSNASIGSLGSTRALSNLRDTSEEGHLKSIAHIPAGTSREMQYHFIGHSQAMLSPLEEILALRERLEELPDADSAGGIAALRLTTDANQVAELLSELLHSWREIHVAIARLRVCAGLLDVGKGPRKRVHCTNTNKSHEDLVYLQRQVDIWESAMRHQASQLKPSLEKKGLITPLVKWTEDTFEVDVRPLLVRRPGATPAGSGNDTRS